MSRRLGALVASGSLAASLLSGCHSGHGTTTTPPPTTTAPGQGTTVPSTTAQPVGVDLPPAATVDLQIAHPDGVTIHVTGIAFYEDNLQLTATVINGRSDDVVLSYLVDDLFLTDDTGIEYRLSPPPGNPKMTVAAGSTMHATLVFLGRIAPKATTVTLTTNASRDDTTGVNSTNPTIRLTNIPVGRPGTSSATTAPGTTTTVAGGPGGPTTSLPGGSTTTTSAATSTTARGTGG